VISVDKLGNVWDNFGFHGSYDAYEQEMHSVNPHAEVIPNVSAEEASKLANEQLQRYVDFLGRH
jgi:hypothetical protein